MGPRSAKSAKYRYFAGIAYTNFFMVHTWKIPAGSLPFSSQFCLRSQILPQTSSQTQGNSRVSRGKLERNRMEHQTPSGFPGNFRKRKVLGTLWFPSGLPETLGQAKFSLCVWRGALPSQLCTRALIGSLSCGLWLVPIHSDTLILKTRPTELRVAPSALPRAPCGHGRCY